MGTFRRTERAFWFLLGALIGGAVVAAFVVLFDVFLTKNLERGKVSGVLSG